MSPVNTSEVEGWEDLTEESKGITLGQYGLLTIHSAQNTSAGRYICIAKSINPTTKTEATISQVSPSPLPSLFKY